MQPLSFVQRFCLSRMPQPAACPAPPPPPTHGSLLALSISLLVLALLTLAIGFTDSVIRQASVVRLRVLSTSVQSRVHAVSGFIFPVIASAKRSIGAGFTTCKAAALQARSSVATSWTHIVAFISYIAASTTAFFGAGYGIGKTAGIRAHNNVSPIWTHGITYINHIAAVAIRGCKAGYAALKAAALRTCAAAATTCTYPIDYIKTLAPATVGVIHGTRNAGHIHTHATAAMASPVSATSSCCSMICASEGKSLHRINIVHLKELIDRAATETGEDPQEQEKDDAHTGRKSDTSDNWVLLNM